MIDLLWRYHTDSNLTHDGHPNKLMNVNYKGKRQQKTLLNFTFGYPSAVNFGRVWCQHSFLNTRKHKIMQPLEHSL